MTAIRSPLNLLSETRQTMLNLQGTTKMACQSERATSWLRTPLEELKSTSMRTLSQLEQTLLFSHSYLNVAPEVAYSAFQLHQNPEKLREAVEDRIPFDRMDLQKVQDKVYLEQMHSLCDLCEKGDESAQFLKPHLLKIKAFFQEQESLAIFEDKLILLMIELDNLPNEVQKNERLDLFAKSLNDDYQHSSISLFPITASSGETLFLRLQKDESISLIDADTFDSIGFRGITTVHKDSITGIPIDQIRYQKLLVLESVNKEKMGSISFFRSFLDIALKAKRKAPLAEIRAKLHDNLLPFVKGSEKILTGSHVDSPLYKKLQTISFKRNSLSTQFFYALLDPYNNSSTEESFKLAAKDFRKVKFLMQRDLLLRFGKALKIDTHVSSTLRLLKAYKASDAVSSNGGLDNLERAAYKGYHKDPSKMAQEYLERTHATVLEIKDLLSEKTKFKSTILAQLTPEIVKRQLGIVYKPLLTLEGDTHFLAFIQNSLFGDEVIAPLTEEHIAVAAENLETPIPNGPINLSLTSLDTGNYDYDFNVTDRSTRYCFLNNPVQHNLLMKKIDEYHFKKESPIESIRAFAALLTEIKRASASYAIYDKFCFQKFLSTLPSLEDPFYQSLSEKELLQLNRGYHRILLKLNLWGEASGFDTGNNNHELQSLRNSMQTLGMSLLARMVKLSEFQHPNYMKNVKCFIGLAKLDRGKKALKQISVEPLLEEKRIEALRFFYPAYRKEAPFSKLCDSSIKNAPFDLALLQTDFIRAQNGDSRYLLQNQTMQFYQQFLNWTDGSVSTYKALEAIGINQEMSLPEQLIRLLSHSHESQSPIPESLLLLQEGFMHWQLDAHSTTTRSYLSLDEKALYFRFSQKKALSQHYTSLQDTIQLRVDMVDEVAGREIYYIPRISEDYDDKPEIKAKTFNGFDFYTLGSSDTHRVEGTQEGAQSSSRIAFKEHPALVKAQLSEDGLKEFQMIFSDPYDRANRLLDFTKKYSKVLDNALYIQLMEKILFFDSSLTDQLASNPSFLNKLEGFLKEAISEALLLDHFQEALLLIELSLTLKSFIQKLPGKKTYPFLTNFIHAEKPKIYEKIQKARDKKGITHFHRVFLTEALLAENSELAFAHYYPLVFLTEKNDIYLKSIEAHSRFLILLEKKGHFLQTIRSNNTKWNALCNTIIEDCLYKKSNTNWVPTLYYRDTFSSEIEGLDIKLNFELAALCIDDELYRGQPKDLLKNPLIQSFLEAGSESFTLCPSIGPNVYQVGNKQGPFYIQGAATNSRSFRLFQIQNNKHYYHLTEAASPTLDPTKRLPRFISKDSTFWQAETPLEKEILIETPNHPNVYVEIDQTRQITKIWMGDDLIQVRRESVRFTDRFPYLNNQNQLFDFWVKSETPEKLHSFSHRNVPLDFNWRAGSQGPKAYCKQLPGYYLSQTIPLGDLHDLAPVLGEHLVLENSKGNRKLILPQEKAFHSLTLSPYGLLEANFPKESLMLTLLYFKGGQFEKALKQLKSIQPLKAFSKEELLLINTLIEQMGKQNSVEAHALICHVMALVSKNSLKFPPTSVQKSSEESISLDPKQASRSYFQYLLNLSNIPNLQLTLEEEEDLLLRLLEPIKLQVLNRIKQMPKMLQAFYINFFNPIQVSTPLYAGFPEAAFPLEWQMSLMHRYEALKKGVCTKTARSFTRITLPSESPELLTRDRLIELFKAPYNQRIKERLLGKEPRILDYPLNQYASLFIPFYEIARSGSSGEKNRLRELIEFNKKSLQAHLPGYSIIQTLLQIPNQFPTLQELEKALDDFNAGNQEIKELEFRYLSSCGPVAKHREQLAILKERQKNLLKPFDCILRKNAEILTIWDVFVSTVKKLLESISICLNASVIPAMDALWHKLRYALLAKKIRIEKPQLSKVLVRSESTITLNELKLKQEDSVFAEFQKNLFDDHFTSALEDAEPAIPLLSEEHPDPLVQKRLKEENEHICSYLKTRASKVELIAPQNETSMGMLKNALTRMINTNLLNQEKLTILAFANTASLGSDLIIRTKKALSHKQIDWQDLKSLFSDCDLGKSKEKLSHLSTSDIKKLYELFASHLVKSTRISQLKRAVVLIEGYQNTTNTVEKRVFLQQLGTLLRAPRAYPLNTENRTKILIEDANGLFYRVEQVEKLNHIITKIQENVKQLLVEAPTSYGKSTIVTTTLNQELADGHILVNTWPAALEEENSEHNAKQFKQNFGKTSDSIQFERSIQLSVANLTKLYHELIRNIAEKKPLNIRAETLLAFQHHYLLLLKQRQESSFSFTDNFELSTLCGLMQLYLRALYTAGIAIPDESDHTLSPFERLIYTTSASQKLKNYETLTIRRIFEILQADKEVWGLLRIKQNEQTSLKEDVYKEKIVPLLTKELALYWEITAENKKEFIDYLTGVIANPPLWVESHPYKQEITLAKGMIQIILPTSFGGHVNENFGCSLKHFQTTEFAIPYECSNTPKEGEERLPSQFQNAHSTLTNTYLTYFHEGLRLNQVEKLIFYLQQEALTEKSLGKPLEETRGFSTLKKILPDYADNLMDIRGKICEKIEAMVKHNPIAIFTAITYLIAPQIKLYPQTICGTGQTFLSMFSQSISLSATPQDQKAHGQETLYIPMEGTSGEVTQLLYTKCANPATLHEISKDLSTNPLEATFKIINNHEKAKAVIDTGGLYRGISNKDLAHKIREKLLANNPAEIVEIVFFDENRFQLLNVQAGNIQLLEDTTTGNIAKRFVVYDQNRARGSNVFVSADALGLVLLAKDSSKRSVAQGVGRIMRTVNKSQSINFGIPSELYKEIFHNRPANINTLMRHLLSKEALQRAQYNYESLIQQLDNIVRSAIMNKLILAKPNADIDSPDVSSAVNLFRDFKKELILEQSFEPYDMYAHATCSASAHSELENYYTRCLKRVQGLKHFTEEEKTELNKRLDLCRQTWVAEPSSQILLPAQVFATKLGVGLQCEVLQQVEVQVQQAVQKQAQTPMRTPLSWKKDTNLFKKGWENPTSLKSIFERAISKNQMAFKFYEKSHEWIHGWYIQFNKRYDSLSWIVPSMLGVIAISTLPLKINLLAGVAFALYYFYPYIKSFINQWFPSPTPCTIFTLSEVMQKTLPYFVPKGVFSSNLLVTENFYHIYGKDLIPAQTPLNHEQKPLYEILFIEDKGNLQALLISSDDSTFFRNKLQEDMKTSIDEANSRKRKIAICNLKDGFLTAQGKNSFLPGELQKNPSFVSLITQAKILSGSLDYSQEELKEVEKIAKHTGFARFANFFNDLLRKLPYTFAEQLPITSIGLLIKRFEQT